MFGGARDDLIGGVVRGQSQNDRGNGHPGDHQRRFRFPQPLPGFDERRPGQEGGRDRSSAKAGSDVRELHLPPERRGVEHRVVGTEHHREPEALHRTEVGLTCEQRVRAWADDDRDPLVAHRREVVGGRLREMNEEIRARVQVALGLLSDRFARVKPELLSGSSAGPSNDPTGLVRLVPRARKTDTVRDRKETTELTLNDGPGERAPEGQDADRAPSGRFAQQFDPRPPLLSEIHGRGHSIPIHSTQREPNGTDLLCAGGAGQKLELVSVRGLDQPGDGPRGWLADRHRIAEVGVGVDRRGHDDPPDRPLTPAAALGPPSAHFDDPPAGNPNVAGTRPLNVQDGTYDKHRASGGSPSAH